MSTTIEAPSVTTAIVDGRRVYNHVLIVPSNPFEGEVYGEEVTEDVLTRIVEAANELQAENPLQFPVRPYGDLIPKEVELVHVREAQVISRAFMASGANLDIGRQLVTFAACRWGHKFKRVSGIIHALERDVAGSGTALWDDVHKNAGPVTEPSYQGPK